MFCHPLGVSGDRYEKGFICRGKLFLIYLIKDNSFIPRHVFKKTAKVAADVLPK